jgi:glycosyltransferase involved in cell wall biosynthesis
MRILWIATKPPWPPRDGGRLLQTLTLEALAQEGIEITVVAPGPVPVAGSEMTTSKAPGHSVRLELVPGGSAPDTSAPRLSTPGSSGVLRTAVRSLATGAPWTVAAHRNPSVTARVAALLDVPGGFDAVHVEQVQAWTQASAARKRGLPTVVRAQNVESDLWRGMARLPRIPRPLRPIFRWQGTRLARWEAAVVRRAGAVTALTRPDATRLSALAGGRRVERVTAPFPERLAPGKGSLEGDPPLVIFGSGGWWPNRDGREWFLHELWPEVFRAVPGVRLHVFGGDPTAGSQDSGMRSHPAPSDSRRPFVPGSILLVPLRLASGVRMKILEAWARGVPVAATPEAAAGLDAEDGRELLLFRDTRELIDALRRLRREPQLAQRLSHEARKCLRRRHDPGRVARELVRIYRGVSGLPDHGYPPSSSSRQ